MSPMGNDRKLLKGLGALAIAMGLNFSSASAQDADRFPAPLPPQMFQSEKPAPIKISADRPGKSRKPYFVEFRARSAHSYGHTFLVHGRSGQKITARDVIGLHPASESSVPWMIGHLIPVTSETGASDGDFEDEYVIARYRVGLTEAEYKKTLAMMRGMQKNHPVWHAVLYNCNRFVGDIAQNMGLKAPDNSLLMPKEYISTLKQLNGGRPELTGPGSAPTVTAAAPAAQRQAAATEQPAASQQQAAPAAPKRQQPAAAAKRKPTQPAQPARQEANVTLQTNQYSRPEW
jgi:hypothetical protein